MLCDHFCIIFTVLKGHCQSKGLDNHPSGPYEHTKGVLQPSLSEYL